MTQPQQPIDVSPDQLFVIVGKLMVENIMLKEQLSQALTFRDQILAPANGVLETTKKDVRGN